MLSLFHSAAIAKGKQQEEWREWQNKTQYSSQPPSLANSLDCNEWVRAVVKGADERSGRWKHLLIIGGLLLGFESRQFMDVPRSLKGTLESALVTATNLALELEGQEYELGSYCVALVINHTFPLLSDVERARLDYDRLLPLLVSTVFFSPEGMESCYFLGAVNLDVVQTQGKKVSWHSKSGSFNRIQKISANPLVSSMGPLCRVMAHAVDNVKNLPLIEGLLSDLVTFSRSLLAQWRQNRLSEIDYAEESVYLQEETLRTTLPVLWRLLKSALFGTVIVLRGIMGRVLSQGFAWKSNGSCSSTNKCLQLMYSRSVNYSCFGSSCPS